MKRLLPFVASLIMPGLGQLLCGRVGRAVVLALLVWGLTAVEWLGLVFAFVKPSFAVYLAIKLTVRLVTLVVALDAWRLAGQPVCPQAVETELGGGEIAPKLGARVYVAFGLLLVLLPCASLLWAAGHFKARVREIHLPANNKSMTPGILPGDIVVVDTSSKGPVSSGDLVLIGAPEVSVRRVIGTPGDLIIIDRGQLIRDAKVLKEDYIAEPMIGNMVATMVLDGRAFVLVDNRNDESSHDSRTYGSVALTDIFGRPLFVLWSSDWHRIGKSVK